MGSKSEHKQPVSTVTVDLQLKSGQKTLANAATIGAGASGTSGNTAGTTVPNPPPAAHAASARMAPAGEMNASSVPAAAPPPPPPAMKPTRSPHPNNALLFNTTSKPAYPGAKHDVRGFCIRHPRCRMVRPLAGEEGGSDPNNYRTVRKICPSCGEQSLVKKERKQPSHGFNPYATRENGEKHDKTNARGGGDAKIFTKVVPKTKSQAAKSPHFRKRLHRANSTGGAGAGAGAAVDKIEGAGKIKSQNETRAQNETERHKPTEGVRINSPSRSNHNNNDGSHRISFKIDPPKDGAKQELPRQKSQSAIRQEEHNKDGPVKNEKKEGMQRQKSQNWQQDKPEKMEELQRQKSQNALRQEEEHGFRQDVREEQKQKGQSAIRQEEEHDKKDEVQRQKSQTANQERRDEMRRPKSQSASRQEETKGEDHGDKVAREDRRDEPPRQKSQCALRQQEEGYTEGGARQDNKDEARRQKEKGGTKQEKQLDTSRQKSQTAIRREEKKDDEQKEGGTTDGTRDDLGKQKKRDAVLREEEVDRENKNRSQSEDNYQPNRKGKSSSKHAQQNTLSSNSQGDDGETESMPIKSSTDGKEKTLSKVEENKESKVSSKGATSPSDDLKRSSKEHNRKPLKLPVEKSQALTKSVKSNSYFVKKKVPGKHDSSNKREGKRDTLDRIPGKKDRHTVKIATESLDSNTPPLGRSRSLSPHRQMSRKTTFVSAKEEVGENDNRSILKQRSKSVGHQIMSRSQRQRISSEFHYVHRPSVNPAPVAAISTYRMEFYDEIEARSCVKSLANI